MNTGTRSRNLFIMLLAMVFIAGAFSSAHAVPSYATSFKSTYPASPLSALSTVSGQAGNLCTVCHGTSGGTRNAFGSDYALNGHNFATVQNLDSDGDGFTNLAEITAGTFPGNAASKPVTTPTACSGYTYSAWSACGTNGQQTRTVTANTPAGCTGTPATAAVLTQACTPPPTTTACTGYTYSAWSACGSNGQQTRTVTANTPAGCTGTPSTAAVLTQACTPPPTTTACTGYTYSAWSACGSNGQQTRTMTAKTPAGCTGTPSAAQVLSQACTPAPATCNYTYSAWSQCRNNTQTRRVTSTSPSRCSGTPILTQTCNSTPPPSGINGTTLYMQRCSACHGSLERSQVRGEDASSIKSAIAEVSQMSQLRNLTNAQIQAIANALVTTPAPPAPPIPAGGIHQSGWINQHPAYVDRNGTSSCKTCHGSNLQGDAGPSCYSCHND